MSVARHESWSGGLGKGMVGAAAAGGGGGGGGNSWCVGGRVGGWRL